MSVVRINSIEVPAGREAEFEERFARRAGQVESSPGFEEFLLLRPTGGTGRYFVLTRWESEEAFQAWTSSRDFSAAHARPGAAPAGPPVAATADLLAFDVIEHVSAPPR